MINEQLQNYFRKLCVEHGCKCTSQRLAVYACLKDNHSHPDVNQIWLEARRTVPSITRESVFRILNELVDFGLINRMDKIINARFDCVPANHGHLICDNCGCIIDIPLPSGIDENQQYPDFQVKHLELRINGLCAQCAANKNHQPSKE